jgi:acyl carrier protein
MLLWGWAVARETRGWSKMNDISERVKAIVATHLGVEPSRVNDGARFVDDLGADSFDTGELVMALEEEFDCEIPPDMAEKILTVSDAIAFVERNKRIGAAS